VSVAEKKSMLLRLFNILTLVASILLLASLSVKIIYSSELAELGSTYSWSMFGVCLIFIADILAEMLHSPHPWRFLLHNLPVLLLSIPWHTIFRWCGVELTHTWHMAMSGVVMLRAVVALYITLRWLIEGRAARLLWAYIATVVVCTYFAALLFYEYEASVNSEVQSFGDALWWASMNMTTVGSSIVPITALGKSMGVVLPIVGMAMFPVFTVYITSLYDKATKRSG
jgi:voltage-gated potassium channel